MIMRDLVVQEEEMSLPKVSLTPTNVPFFRPSITDSEIREVVDTLRSGWLTTGPKVKKFETAFATAVGARYAVAVNSCTAALHLGIEALNIKAGQAVLIPTMTFAATAEVVRYQGGIPILVDCDPRTLNLSFEDAEYKLDELRKGNLPPTISPEAPVVGIIPVHVGGMMVNVKSLRSFADKHGLWTVEDAAHSFPAAWRQSPDQAWQYCGQQTAAISCYSFYANKTITTGEGGMATTDSPELADRMRMMSLHGLSHDAWDRYSGGGSWDYKISAPGYKYNLTDIAAAIGIHQLERAEEMRQERETIANYYLQAMADIEEVELPPQNPNRIHSWHLFPIKLRLERLAIRRNEFIEELKSSGVGCSVHWRPLHLHPYYQEKFNWRAEDFPATMAVWERLISLPIFPGMRQGEMEHVTSSIRSLCARHAK
jgi:dTDP-4-amino-4,6-dideoxygalactose transaminase